MATSTKSKPAKPSGNGQQITNNQMEELRSLTQMVVNATTLSRTQMAAKLMDPRRNMDDECGYPSTSEINAQLCKDMYNREAIAARVVQVLPQESWRVQPTIIEEEDADNKTPFELAWKDATNNLRGNSWFDDPESNPIWDVLLRADELSGIGHYGILLLGLDDSKKLEEPVDGINEKGEAVGLDELTANLAPVKQDEEGAEGQTRAKATTEEKPKAPKMERELLFLRAFDETAASVLTYEEDQTNPRFMQPTMYMVNMGGIVPGVLGQQPGQGLKVHWTRVIHIADNLGSSEIIGVPRMRPVYNRLHDLRKLYGGSAEMYYKGAFPGLSIETHPALGGEVTIDKADMKVQLEAYMNSLQRYLALSGVHANSLAPQVVNPKAQIEVQLTAICVQIGTPVRVFLGSERGELASSQDAKAWNGRLKHRQTVYITPRIIVPFIDRLITVRVLPVPPNGYSAVWPDLDSLTDDEQATIAVKRTESLAKYVQGGVENLIAPVDFLTRIIGLTQAEAEAIMVPVEELLAQKVDDELAQAEADEDKQFGHELELVKEKAKRGKNAGTV